MTTEQQLALVGELLECIGRYDFIAGDHHFAPYIDSTVGRLEASADYNATGRAAYDLAVQRMRQAAVDRLMRDVQRGGEE